MRSIHLFALAIVLSCQPLGAVHAQVFVSNNGSDALGCGAYSSPCRSLGGAVSNITNHFEIRCVDALEINGVSKNVTISQSITIDCRGAYAGHTMSNLSGFDTGFIIDGPGINVTLRGVNIFSNTANSGTGKIGIDIRQAASVTIEDCRIDVMTSQGVYDHRSTAGKLLIKDTVITRIGSGTAIAVAGPAHNAAIIDNVTLDSNLNGVTVAAFNKATITGSHITNNAGNGVQGDTNAFVIVNGSTISSNASGIVSDASVRLSNNDIAFNNRAIGGASGTYGNNRFSGNTTIGTAPTPLGGASSDVAQQ